MPDQRREIRYGTTPIITRLEVKKFLHTSIINGSINNISKSGAAIQTSVPLTENYNYRLDTKFRIRRVLKPFSAVFSVKYCNRMGEIYFNRYTSGGIFEKSSISPEHQKILDEFIMSMEKI